jgi:LPS sulfotransferase NodH
VILSVGRTGSELLVSLLDSHPLIVCDGEVLNPRPRFSDHYLAANAARAGLRGARAYGWKLLQGQIPNDGYVSRLHNRGYRIIFLERRDLVQQAISFIRAERIGYHHRRDDNATYPALHIPAVEVLVAAYFCDQGAAVVRSMVSQVPHLALVYEDDLADGALHQGTVDRVCRYLGLPSAPVASDHVKITPRRTRDMVTNFDEIAALLNESPYAVYLGDASSG